MRHTLPQPTTEMPDPARALTMERMKAAGFVDSKLAPDSK